MEPGHWKELVTQMPTRKSGQTIRETERRERGQVRVRLSATATSALRRLSRDGEGLGATLDRLLSEGSRERRDTRTDGWLQDGLRETAQLCAARPELRARVQAHPSGFIGLASQQKKDR